MGSQKLKVCSASHWRPETPQFEKTRAHISSSGMLAASLALAAAGVFTVQSGAYAAAVVIGAFVSLLLIAVILARPGVGLLLIAVTTPLETFGSLAFRV